MLSHAIQKKKEESESLLVKEGKAMKFSIFSKRKKKKEKMPRPVEGLRQKEGLLRDPEPPNSHPKPRHPATTQKQEEK